MCFNAHSKIVQNVAPAGLIVFTKINLFIAFFAKILFLYSLVRELILIFAVIGPFSSLGLKPTLLEKQTFFVFFKSIIVFEQFIYQN